MLTNLMIIKKNNFFNYRLISQLIIFFKLVFLKYIYYLISILFIILLLDLTYGFNFDYINYQDISYNISVENDLMISVYNIVYNNSFDENSYIKFNILKNNISISRRFEAKNIESIFKLNNKTNNIYDSKEIISKDYYLINNILCKSRCIIKNNNIELCKVVNDTKNCSNINFKNPGSYFFDDIEIIYNSTNFDLNNSLNNSSKDLNDFDISYQLRDVKYIFLENTGENYLLNKYMDQEYENLEIINREDDLVRINSSLSDIIFNISNSSNISDNYQDISYKNKEIIKTTNDLFKKEIISSCGIRDFNKILNFNFDLNNIYLINKNNCILSDRDSLYTINKTKFEDYYFSLNSLRKEKINFYYNGSFILNNNNTYCIFYNDIKDVEELYKMSLVLKNNEIFYFDNIYSSQRNVIEDYELIENDIISLNRTGVVVFTALDKEIDQNRYINSLKFKFSKIYVIYLYDNSNYDIFDLKEKLKRNLLDIYNQELNNNGNFDTLILFNYAAKIFYELNFEENINWESLKIVLKSPILDFNEETWFSNFLSNNKNGILNYLKNNDKLKINQLFVPKFSLREFATSSFFYYTNRNNENILSREFLKYMLSKIEYDKRNIFINTSNLIILYNNFLGTQDSISNSLDSFFLADKFNTSIISRPCLYYTIKQIDSFEDSQYAWILRYLTCDNYDSLLENILYV